MFRSFARTRPGYTIVELVIVLIIIGIITGLAIPRIDLTRYKADADVTAIRSIFQQAQRASLVSQYDIIVSFDVPGNRVRMIWDANNDHLASFGEHVEWRSLSTGNKFAVPPIGIHGTVTKSIVGATMRTMDGMPTATFHRDGSLSSDLEVYLSTIATTAWRAITVIQATGRSDWYRIDPKTNKWSSGAL